MLTSACHTTHHDRIMLAADVVYVDEWTTAFADAIALLLAQPLQPGKGLAGTPGSTDPRVLFLTIEKRINFTVEDLEPTCHAYKHFEHEIVHNQCVLPVPSVSPCAYVPVLSVLVRARGTPAFGLQRQIATDTCFFACLSVRCTTTHKLLSIQDQRLQLCTQSHQSR